jgi:hypothetical protein
MRLVLSKAIPGAGTGEGGLTVQWTGSTQGVSGHVEIAEPSGGIVSYQLQGGYSFDTENTLSAPWWLPDNGSNGSLTLFNTGKQTIIVSPSILVEGVKKTVPQISVPPNAMQQLELRTLLTNAGIKDASLGAITLHYNGSPHALQPALTLFNSETGFSLMAKFDASHAELGQQQTSWQFPTVALAVENNLNAGQASEPLNSYMLLSNSTPNQISPNVTAFAVSSGEERKAALTVPPISPYGTRLVNLSQLSGQLPAGISRMALTLSHVGQPGDLGVSIFSIDKSNQVVTQSAGELLDTTALSIGYWDTSSGRIQFQHITNGNGSVEPVTATIYYQALGGVGSYTFPGTFSIEPSQDKVINLSQISRLQVADGSGHKLPMGVKSGLIILRTTGGSTSSVTSNVADTCSTTCAAQPSLPAANNSLANSTAEPNTQIAIKSQVSGQACTVPVQPPPTPWPECGAIIYYRPITGTLGNVATHSFFYVQDSVGNQLVIDGGPSIPRCFNDPNCLLIDWTYLAPQGYYPQDNIYTATPYEGTPAAYNVCSNIDALEIFAQNWTPVPYSGASGPNSNTFTHDCAIAAGFTAGQPPGAVGW